MRRSLVVSLVGIVAFAAIALMATLASGNSPKLGLDLQGGVSVVLAPAPGQIVKPGALDEAKKIIDRRVNGLGVTEANVVKQGNNIVVELPGVKDQEAALKIVGATAQLEFRPVIGQPVGFSGTLDPSTGQIVTTSTTAAPKRTTTTAPTTTTAQATTTTAPRATSTTKGALGTSGPGQVSIAGAAPAQVAPATTTATTAPAAPPTTVPATPPPPQLTPRDQIDKDKPAILAQTKPGTNEIVALYQLDKASLTGDIVSSAISEFSPNLSDGWIVTVHFTGAGQPKFTQLSTANIGKQVAIVLDGVVVSAPTINVTITGNAQISGGFTHKQTNDLALVLRFGSLPLKLDQQTVQKVSPSLGKDSLRAGLVAGMIGLVLVLLYMLLYYRGLGLVVLLGLCVSGALMYSIVTFLGTTSFGLALSLSGVTGIVVAVGVTVDSYIVYFERLKDEIRAGRSVRSSVDRGFGRAWRTIVSADSVSFIGAFLLFWLSVGQVRGFAFFLGLSTLLDLLVAYTFTRPMVILLGNSRTFTQARVIGVARGLAAAPVGTTL